MHVNFTYHLDHTIKMLRVIPLQQPEHPLRPQHNAMHIRQIVQIVIHRYCLDLLHGWLVSSLCRLIDGPTFRQWLQDRPLKWHLFCRPIRMQWRHFSKLSVDYQYAANGKRFLCFSLRTNPTHIRTHVRISQTKSNEETHVIFGILRRRN